MIHKLYWQCGLWRIDLWMLWYYSLGRAFRTSLRNRPRKRLLGLTYGETPLYSFGMMMDWAQPKKNDIFLELGSGTGRLSLMVSKTIGLRCVGIDCIAPFVQNANMIAKRLHISCTFEEGDFFEYSWADADILYITATASTEEQIQRMSEKCRELKEGARLLSLTHPPQSDCMTRLGMKMMDFSWGATAVFLSERNAQT